MKNSKRNLGFESLEDRRMMAGDVAAYVQSGNLYINEAAGQTGLDNGVLISQVSTGVVRVQGTAPSGTGAASKVNGAAFQDFKVVGSLFVSFGAGNDKVEIGGAGGAVSFQSVDLNMGPVSVGAGVSDKDTVSVQNLHTTAGLSINTGADNDNVYVGSSIIGDDVSNDQLWIRTGAGSDQVSLESYLYVHGSMSIQTYDSLAENDSDTVYIDKYVQVDTDASIATGGGNDNVYFGTASSTQGYEYSLNVGDSLMLDTGTGDDTIAIYDAFSGANLTNTTTIITGAGADNVDINGSTTWLTNLNLLTYSSTSEVDTDIVRIHSIHLGGNAYVGMGDGADQFTVDVSDPSQPDVGASTSGSLYVDTGAGNDTVSISGMDMSISTSNVLTIHTGAGQDSVNIHADHWLQGLAIQTYDSLSENDADSVVISDTYTHGAMSVLLGGGNDYFSIGGGTYSFSNITIDAGTGNDRGYDYTLSAKNQISINMNDGDDILCIDSIVAPKLTLAGGNGYDHLGITNNIVVDSIFESGWELYNHFNTLADELKANPTTFSNIGKVG